MSAYKADLRPNSYLIQMGNKLKIGIFFGGPSREREISFAGGKTAFENIDKAIFEPIPIFVDSLGHFILLKDELLYEQNIRDFYPSKNLNRGYSIYIESLGELNETQLYKLIYKIGREVKPDELASLMDFAFVVMHGPQAEDGAIQGLLEWYGIPYMGPGIMGSAVGIDKPMQNKLISLVTNQQKKFTTLTRQVWHDADKELIFNELVEKIGLPIVAKAPHQGSSIGVAIVRKKVVEDFIKAVNQCLFEVTILANEWNKMTDRQKKNLMEKTSNLDEGIGFPVALNEKLIYHPADLVDELDKALALENAVTLVSANAEDFVLFEEFTTGQEFSCGVIQDDDGSPIALPPTEIYGDAATFDFKSKYKTNVIRKRIPVDTSLENLQELHKSVKSVFKDLGFTVVTRIDGFVTPDNKIILHDPNSIPGMSPTSFIFKQMAEIGLNVSQSITYLIRQSVRERIRLGKNTVIYRQLLEKLDLKIAERVAKPRKKVAIVFGEIDEQYETARKKFNELAASTSFEPFGVCAANNGAMYKIPMNLFFKQDIADFGKNVGLPKHPFVEETMEKAKNITARFAGNFDTKVKKISELELAEMANYVFYAETGEMVEL